MIMGLRSLGRGNQRAKGSGIFSYCDSFKMDKAIQEMPVGEGTGNCMKFMNLHHKKACFKNTNISCFNGLSRLRIYHANHSTLSETYESFDIQYE